MADGAAEETRTLLGAASSVAVVCSPRSGLPDSACLCFSWLCRRGFYQAVTPVILAVLRRPAGPAIVPPSGPAKRSPR